MESLEDFESRVKAQPYNRRVLFRLPGEEEHLLLVMETCPALGDSIYGYSSLNPSSLRWKQIATLKPSDPRFLKLLICYANTVANDHLFKVVENTYDWENNI